MLSICQCHRAMMLVIIRIWFIFILYNFLCIWHMYDKIKIKKYQVLLVPFDAIFGSSNLRTQGTSDMWCPLSCLLTRNHKNAIPLPYYRDKWACKIAIASCQEVDVSNQTVEMVDSRKLMLLA